MLDKIFNRKMMVVLVSGFLIGGCHSENSMLNLNKAEVGGGIQIWMYILTMI